MIELVFLGIIFLVALGIGNRILPWFGNKFECFMEEQLIAVGLGFGALIIGVYFLGWAHLLSKTSIIWLLFLALLTGRTPLIQIINSSRARFKEDALIFSWWQKLAIIILMIMGIFNLLGAMAPTTDTDGLAYHLAVPKFYLQQGGFDYSPIMVFNWPLSIEMIYTIAIAISNDSLAKLIHLMFGVLSAIAVYILTKEWFGKQAGIMATILFYAIPLVGLESGIAYVDLATTFYILVGTNLFMKWYLKDEGTMLLSGIFIGIGASTKWNGPITILILTIFCAHKVFFSKKIEEAGVRAKKQKKESGLTGKRLIVVIMFLLIASSFSFMWYAKNYILTGNPVAPFLGDKITTRDWGPENTVAYKSSVASLYLSPIHFFLIPWALTMHGLPFGELTYLGPWFLMLMPLALLIRKWPKAAIFISTSSLIYYIIWFSTSQQSRLLLPTLAILCAICGWAVTHERFAHLQKAIYCALILSVLLAIPFTALYNGKGAKASLGLETREDYLERLLPDSATIHWANKNLPAGSRILLVRENNAYLLDHNYLWGDAAMQGIIDYKRLGPGSLYDELKLNGITHIIVNRAIKCADPKDEPTHCPDIKGLLETPITRNRLMQLYTKNEVFVYQVT